MNIDGDEADELLFNLVYCSRAAPGVSITQIREMVAAAQKKNARLQVTGWLVFSNGIFFQWLEGSKSAVTELMASIRSDPRHNSVVILSEAVELRARVFSEWDMELVSKDEIRAVLLDAIDASANQKVTIVLRRLLVDLESNIPQA